MKNNMTPTPVTPTGSDDTAALQAAFDEAAQTASAYDVNGVYLCGTYRVSAPLQIGHEGTPMVLVHGSPHATIVYVGPKTDEYLITYQGERRCAAVRMQGLWLDCKHNCRGLRVIHQAYAGGLANLYIRDPRQVGLRLGDCWGTDINNVIFSSCNGVVLWADSFNSGQMRLMKLAGRGYYHADYKLNEELNGYICANGVKAAKEKYGDDMLEDWPSIAELPVADRAAVICTGGNSSFENMDFEGCYYAGYPLLRPGTIQTWRDTRFEGNYNGSTKILMRNVTHTVFDGVSVSDGQWDATGWKCKPERQCGSLVRYEGITGGNVISRVRAGGGGFTKAVTVSGTGTHWGNRIERSTVWCNNVPMHMAEGGAVVHDELPEHRF